MPITASLPAVAAHRPATAPAERLPVTHNKDNDNDHSNDHNYTDDHNRVHVYDHGTDVNNNRDYCDDE